MGTDDVRPSRRAVESDNEFIVRASRCARDERLPSVAAGLPSVAERLPPVAENDAREQCLHSDDSSTPRSVDVDHFAGSSATSGDVSAAAGFRFADRFGFGFDFDFGGGGIGAAGAVAKKGNES